MIFHRAIEGLYRAQMFARCDGNGLAHYFSHEDFEGLAAEPYTFRTSQKNALKGYFYGYEGCDRDRLVIFEHGFGGGHRSYMKEIERLCRAGHRVFAYDQTGCMESEGRGAGGFAQAIRDLDDCLDALKSDESVNTSDISVIGHSRGGLATMNALAFHPDVKRIVVLSGPISTEAMVGQLFSGAMGGYRKHIMAVEREANPEYVDCNAVRALENSKVKALLIYSDNDPLVHKSVHFDALQAGLAGKDNIELMLVSGKGHNPNYTHDAVAYLGELAEATKRAEKRLKTDAERESFKNSFDWHRMTAQDDAIWARITEFLK